MTVKGKLITVGVVAGCIGISALVIQWFALSGEEAHFWGSSSTPYKAHEYIWYASELENGSRIKWYMMRISPTMRAHLEQRRREAEAYEATLPSDAERRKKMRDDYEKSAAANHLSPAMTNAMLALIDQANAQGKAVPLGVTVKNTVQPGDDRDLELANGTDSLGNPVFNPKSRCDWDMRQHSQPLALTNLGVENEGIFITITLKDVPEPLVLRETVEDESRVRKVRQLGATVEVNVVPPVGPTVQVSREVSMEWFALEAKVPKGKSIGLFSIYTEQIKMLATNSCVEVCSLLGTLDRMPTEPK